MRTRVAVGRARVVPEIRAAAGLLAAVRAPVTARGPWLTAVLDAGAVTRPRARPVAVVVCGRGPGRPEGGRVPVRPAPKRDDGRLDARERDAAAAGRAPDGPVAARDEAAATMLAEAIPGLQHGRRPPWALQLAGLPLGDPVLRALSARLPTSVLGNVRSTLLVDELDELAAPGGPAPLRSRDPGVLDRWLPALLSRADPGARPFLRASARLHAAIGELELAVVAEGGDVRAALLSLVDGDDRWPWWGTGDAGLRTQMGAPLVGLEVPARGWPWRSALSPAAGR